ncbi:MAG: hypothetical protein Q8M23_03200, partial [Bacteroidales bacterium]|nr:hypothetical protein [Bacteroidales bacterium]
ILLEFLKSVTLVTVGQLVSVFGVFFIFGLILYFLARSTRRVYVNSAGTTLDIILTGWIGTPVHELGHALFCLLFLHKIEKIKLFDPNPTDGSLGYVKHSYNKKNLYQRIGNFFIGVGPIMLGSAVLYATMYLLIPGIKNVFTEIEKHGSAINNAGFSNWQLIFQSAWSSITIILGAITDPNNFGNWKFWLFIYISMSVASHMELSPSDLKSALGGFLILALFVFFINLVVMVFQAVSPNMQVASFFDHFSLQTYMASLGRFTGFVTALFMYAFCISALNLLVSWALLSVYSLIRGRGVINPFWS